MIKGVRDLQGRTDSIFGKKNNLKKPQKFNTPCKTRWDVVGYPLRKNKGVYLYQDKHTSYSQNKVNG